jgi:collagenase-like PrtC family protease
VNGNYTEKQLPMVMSLVNAFEEMGGTGIMVADIALLSLLKKRKSKLIRGLSLLAAASNTAAIEFYAELGVSRVVFPRFLTYEQINRIVTRFPDIEAECIIFLDKCKFVDGYCRFIHSVGYQSCDCSENANDPENIVTSYDVNYRLPACFELFGYPPDSPACGACGIGSFEKAGVSVFKMGGRGRPLSLREAGVRFLQESGKSKNNSEIKKLYNDYFNSPCCNDVCYVPNGKK